MTTFITTTLTIAASLLTMQLETGYASRYDPGVMEYVAAYHGHDLAQYDGAIAALSCDWIGQEWYIRQPGGEWYHVIVSDCAGDGATFEWMRDNGILLELSYPLAVEFDAVGGGVEVEVLRP